MIGARARQRHRLGAEDHPRRAQRQVWPRCERNVNTGITPGDQGPRQGVGRPSNPSASCPRFRHAARDRQVCRRRREGCREPLRAAPSSCAVRCAFYAAEPVRWASASREPVQAATLKLAEDGSRRGKRRRGAAAGRPGTPAPVKPQLGAFERWQAAAIAARNFTREQRLATEQIEFRGRASSARTSSRAHRDRAAQA